MADLEQNVWRKFRERGLQVIAVNRGQSRERIRAFAERIGATFPLLEDPSASIYRLYNGESSPRVAPFPRDVLIDPSGQVRYYSRVYEPRILLRKVEEILESSGVSCSGDGNPPKSFELVANPNPFREGVLLTYRLRRPTSVHVGIFDVRGRRVAELYNGYRPAGAHLLRWNGLADDGAPVPPGIYFCVLRAGGHSAAVKLVRLP